MILSKLKKMIQSNVKKLDSIQSTKYLFNLPGPSAAENQNSCNMADSEDSDLKTFLEDVLNKTESLIHQGDIYREFTQGYKVC